MMLKNRILASAIAVLSGSLTVYSLGFAVDAMAPDPVSLFQFFETPEQEFNHAKIANPVDVFDAVDIIDLEISDKETNVFEEYDIGDGLVSIESLLHYNNSVVVPVTLESFLVVDADVSALATRDVGRGNRDRTTPPSATAPLHRGEFGRGTRTTGDSCTFGDADGRPCEGVGRGVCDRTTPPSATAPLHRGEFGRGTRTTGDSCTFGCANNRPNGDADRCEHVVFGRSKEKYAPPICADECKEFVEWALNAKEFSDDDEPDDPRKSMRLRSPKRRGHIPEVKSSSCISPASITNWATKAQFLPFV